MFLHYKAQGIFKIKMSLFFLIKKLEANQEFSDKDTLRQYEINKPEVSPVKLETPSSDGVE